MAMWSPYTSWQCHECLCVNNDESDVCAICHEERLEGTEGTESESAEHEKEISQSIGSESGENESES